MKIIGKNTNFFVVWNCAQQTYKAYKGSKLLATEYRYRDVECYLN